MTRNRIKPEPDLDWSGELSFGSQVVHHLPSGLKRQLQEQSWHEAKGVRDMSFRLDEGDTVQRATVSSHSILMK